MFIWIDGTYGAGKTTISSQINKMIDNSILIKSDDFYNNIWCKYINDNGLFGLALLGGGQFSKNKCFLNMFKNYISEKCNNEKNIVVIDYCILNESCHKLLFDPINMQYFGKHIILETDKDVLIKRCEKQKTRDMQFALSFYKDNIEYIHNYPDAARINTCHKTINEIVNECLRILKNGCLDNNVVLCEEYNIESKRKFNK